MSKTTLSLLLSRQNDRCVIILLRSRWHRVSPPIYGVVRTRTRWIRMAVHLVRVSSYAHATAERRCRISTSPLSDFHGGTAALRARRPVRPTGPLSVHGAISHLGEGKKNKRKFAIALHHI